MRLRSPRLARLAPLWVSIALCLIQPSCSNPTALVVKVSQIPTAATAVDAIVVLNGVPANESPHVPLPSMHDSYSFDLLLPLAAMGHVQLGIGARDAQGCLLALGQGEAELRPADTGYAFEVAVPLRAASGVGMDCGALGPVIDRVTPPLLSTAGGDTLTVEGFAFSPGAVVQIAGIDAPTTWSSPTELRAIVPARLGQAGKVSLVVTNSGGRQDQRLDLLGYYYGVPGYTLQTVPLAGGAADHTLADFDKDGLLDVAVATDALYGPNPPGVQVLINRGKSNFAPPATYPLAVPAVGIAAADFNQDGSVDLALLSYPADGRVYLMLNNGDGTFAPAVPATGSIGQSSWRAGPLAVDVDGDDRPELAVRSAYGGSEWKLAVFQNQGAGQFSTPADVYSVSGGSDLGCIAAADLDNDGRIDLVSAYMGGIDVLINQGSGRFPGQAAHYTLGNLPVPFDCVRILTGDVDGNGFTDLVLFEPLAQSRGIVVARNQGGGVYGGSADIYPVAQTGPWAVAALGDFDQDGRPDLVHVRYIPTTSLLFRRNQGDGIFLTPAPIPFANNAESAGGAAFYTASVADVNEDGRPDLVVTGNSLNIFLNAFR